ncbi:MAG: polysaccharide biosynthesis protein [Bacteroidetes bacterium]|nr:polysaccharide biosynthesis protein [Bacteroidota bacterium]
MSRSLKVNYIFNLVNTVTGILFPLISFPYASRILMADGIGQVNFFQSIINYVSLLSCLGIPMYAIREIAKVRDNVPERNKITLEILLLHTMLTALGYLVVAILAVTVAKIQVDIPLFLLLSLSILFTAIGCEWFYQGVEDFKYITIRGIVVKTVAIVFLFLLVKTKGDILWYALYTVIGSVGGNIFNFIRLRKYITHITFDWRELRPFRHLLPAMHIFVLNLIISIYINLNSVMLGFMKNNESVGFFTAATKLTQVTLGIVSSLGAVMLPRLSNLISNKQWDEFRALSQKSMSFVVAVTLPLSVALMLVAPYIIPIFCGESYDKAIPTLFIIAPIVLFVGMSNVLGIQILYPQGKENTVIVCTAIGAVANFALNLWLIPLFAQDGAAVATVVAELLVTVSMIALGRKHLPLKWDKSYWTYLAASLLMGFVIYCCKFLDLNNIFTLLFSVVSGTLVYALFLVVAKDPFYLELKAMVVKRKQ